MLPKFSTISLYYQEIKILIQVIQHNTGPPGKKQVVPNDFRCVRLVRRVRCVRQKNMEDSTCRVIILANLLGESQDLFDIWVSFFQVFLKFVLKIVFKFF